MYARSRYLILFALAALPLATRAHTTLANTSPKDNATLAQSPHTIEIQFRDPAKLTALVAIDPAEVERKLPFNVGAKPNSYVTTEPNLTSGRNEIRWTALSHDGHVIRGTLVFTVKSAAPQQ